MARSRRLRAAIAEAKEKAHEEVGALWGVSLDAPVADIWCDADHETVPVCAALVARHRKFEILPTDVEGIELVRADPPLTFLAVREPFMAGFVGALRRSGAHGEYYEVGEKRKYRF